MAISCDGIPALFVAKLPAGRSDQRLRARIPQEKMSVRGRRTSKVV
jgi:hypothetical protein